MPHLSALFNTKLTGLVTGLWLKSLTKGKIRSNPTYRCTATNSVDTFQYLYILTKKHFFIVGVRYEDLLFEEESKRFIQSFELKK